MSQSGKVEDFNAADQAIQEHIDSLNALKRKHPNLVYSSAWDQFVQASEYIRKFRRTMLEDINLLPNEQYEWHEKSFFAAVVTLMNRAGEKVVAPEDARKRYATLIKSIVDEMSHYGIALPETFQAFEGQSLQHPYQKLGVLANPSGSSERG